MLESIKVQFLDINKTTGEETLKSLNNQHANGHANFICCDVTSQDQLDGQWMSVFLTIIYAN